MFLKYAVFKRLRCMNTRKLKERLVSLAVLSGGGVAAFCAIGLWCNDRRLFEALVMPLARRLEPETAHRAAVWAARHGLVPRDRCADPAVLRTHALGLQLSNPVCLAAGFDKHAEACDAMLAAGFGLVEVGSVTPLPQPGNPPPRIFRLPDDDAVINRYGFNSDGHAVVAARLTARPAAAARVGVNLGKNKATEDAAADYEAGVAAFGHLAAYLVINVSSPNTPGLRELQTGEELAPLLDRVLAARDRLPRAAGRPPVLLKISPDLTEQQRRHVARCVLDRKERLDGLIVSNTTVCRPEGLRSAAAAETGGLSGRPLADLSTAAVAEMYRLTGGAVPIVGAGGVSSGRQAYAKVRAGASLVQLYTALALHGPPVVAAVKRELAQLIEADGFTSVAEAVGADHRSPVGSGVTQDHTSRST